MEQLSQELRERLLAALRQAPPLVIAVLFGSRASGHATALSDFDIAVLPLGSPLSLHEELALASALSATTGTEVDVVSLGDAPPLLRAEVARGGICLFENEPGAFSAFRARAIAEWIEFDEVIAPHRAKFLQRLAGTARCPTWRWLPESSRCSMSTCGGCASDAPRP